MSIQFLEEIKIELEDSDIVSEISVTNDVGKLTITTTSYSSFYNYLYNDSVIFMIRKKDKFTQILSTTFFIQKESIPCKFCNSNNTVCDGYDYYKLKKQRYLCKTCKRHFTAPISSNINGGGDELLES